MDVDARTISKRQDLQGSKFEQALDVAACIVRDGAGRVLMAERRADQLSAGHWELPGGKLEPGETAAAAAARELFEETGLKADGLKPFATYCHRFPTRRVNLTIFEVSHWQGIPAGREHQRVDWVDPSAPHLSPLLPSNIKALQLLSLPRVVLGTLAPCCNTPIWAQSVVKTAQTLGAGAILLTDQNLIAAQRASLARRLASQSARSGLPLWVEDGGAPQQAALQVVSDRSLLPASSSSSTIYGLIERDVLRLVKELTPQADFFIVPLPKVEDDTRGAWQAFATLTATAATPVYAMIPDDPAAQAAVIAAGGSGVCIAAQ